jgi:opacity protein-like surface antigen
MRYTILVCVCMAFCMPSIHSQVPKHLISAGWQGYALFDGTGYIYQKRERFSLGITSGSYQFRIKERWFTEIASDGYYSLTLGSKNAFPKVWSLGISRIGFRIGSYFYQQGRLSMGVVTGLSYHLDTKAVQLTEQPCNNCFSEQLYAIRKGFSSIPIIGKAQFRLHRQVYLSANAGYFFGFRPYTVTTPYNNTTYLPEHRKFFRKDSFSCNLSVGIGFDKNSFAKVFNKKKKK